MKNSTYYLEQINGNNKTAAITRFMTKIALLTIIVFSFINIQPAAATPAWMRWYQEKDPTTDCQSCHTQGGWQLNKTGITFMRYGHHLEEDNGNISNILSNYTSFAFKARMNGGNDKNETFEQHSFSIYTGGVLDKGFSYFAELYFHENTGQTSGPSDFGDHARSKLAEAYIQYTKGGEDKFFTTRFGQILPQLLHINNLGARMSQSRPALWSKATINNGNKHQPYSRQYGLEGSYYVNGLTTTLGVVNGTGTEINIIDNNDHKDFYGSVDYTWGRHGSNVGLLHYTGKASIFDNTTNNLLYDDSFDRTILTSRLAFGTYDLTAAYMMGSDEIDSLGNTNDGDGFYIQPNYHPAKNWGVFARYDSWQADGGPKLDGTAIGASWLLSLYGRLVLDVSHYGPEDDKTMKWTLVANFMF